MLNEKKGAVLITGASSGIGKACALLLDKSGYHVFAGVRGKDAGQRLQVEGSKYISPVLLDITDSTHIALAVKTVTESLGTDQRLVGLVNNAGIGMAGPTEFMPIDALRQHMEVNTIGQIAVTQAFLSLIRKGRGRIIYIGSGSGRFALPLLGAYAASKFALRALADSLRRELRAWHIPVSIVELGTVETQIWDKGAAESDKILSELSGQANELYGNFYSSTKMIMEKARRRATSPETVAGVVRRVLEARRPKASYVVGIDAYMSIIANFLPNRWTDWIIDRTFVNKLSSKILGW